MARPHINECRSWLRTIGNAGGCGVGYLEQRLAVQAVGERIPEALPMPDTDSGAPVVAMPLGQGHRHYGKFADGRGENPFVLLPDAADPATGNTAWQSTRVALSKAAIKGRLVRFGFPEGQWKPDQFIA